ncbi:MAG: hypothetical protein Q7R46_00950 [bacterium]|nr:hypothetical protein [bacterium]
MQQVLIFIIIIGIGAFYLFSQVQPEIASWFDRDLKVATSTSKITAKSPGSSSKTAPKTITTQPATPPVTQPKSDISPYVGKVKISGIRKQTLTTPSLITLTATGQIDITGWKFETKTGYFLIPKGMEQINPFSPALVLQDILVKSGDTIYLSSDQNPFLQRNKNFRPNKCMGYLSNSVNFTIPLPQSCPQIQIDKLPSYLNYWCKEYIKTLGNCKIPTSDSLAKYELGKDDSCMSYLNANYNYSGCFSNYQKDQDFYSNQWHIYLDLIYKEIFPWTNEFDTLYLKDKNGLIIDKYDFGSRTCCD